jgi:Flp pilus assembly protein TadB
MVENGGEAGPVVDSVAIDVDSEEDDDHGVNADEVKADRLYDIAQNVKLSLLLKDWEKQFKVARERIETKTTRTNSAKNDLYQWIGFFSVFQGVVLTAVAQASTLGCQQSWAPASLSLIASVVTIVSVRFKLKSYRALEDNLANETHDSKILHEQIAELKTQGTSFKFSWFLDRAKRQKADKKKADKKKTDEQKAHGNKKQRRRKDRYYWAWDWAVILALVLFSTIILLCCILVLCGPDKHKPGT